MGTWNILPIVCLTLNSSSIECMRRDIWLAFGQHSCVASTLLKWGLTTDQMLKKPDGQPFVVGGDGPTKYYILDFTQPEVAAVLQDVARKFIRRYKPDLLKFDFGYEMPSVATAAPRDKKFTGERLMWKGLDVLITAMRKILTWWSCITICHRSFWTTLIS